jgi:hypothetical protein
MRSALADMTQFGAAELSLLDEGWSLISHELPSPNYFSGFGAESMLPSNQTMSRFASFQKNGRRTTAPLS